MKTLAELFEKFDAMPIQEQSYWVFRFIREGKERIEMTQEFVKWSCTPGVPDFCNSEEFDSIRIQAMKDIGVPAEEIDRALHFSRYRKESKMGRDIVNMKAAAGWNEDKTQHNPNWKKELAAAQRALIEFQNERNK